MDIQGSCGTSKRPWVGVSCFQHGKKMQCLLPFLALPEKSVGSTGIISQSGGKSPMIRWKKYGTNAEKKPQH
jgi:hypothetical protein